MLFLAQGKTNWKYLIIVLILAVIVGGGILIYLRDFKKEMISISQFPEIRKPEKVIRTGVIEGSLGYPSESIPEEMEVCAEDILTKKQYCTKKHIQDKKYTFGVGYKLEVPVGDYYVFAILPSWGNYKAYYSEFVTCGLKIDCLSHEPIIVKVRANETIENINPIDWYRISEQIPNEGITSYTTYRNKQYGYEVKYPSDWTIYSSVNWLVEFKSKSLDKAFEIEILETKVIPVKPSPICLAGRCSEATFFKDKEITFNTLNGIQREIIYSNFPGPLISIETYILKDKLLFTIKYRHWGINEITSEDVNFYNQMLSTFRFLE